MSAQARKNRRPARGIRGWLVPIGIILIAALLITLVVLQMRPQEPAPGAAADTAHGNAHAPAEQPDLSQFEYRQEGDVQAAGPVDAPVGLVVFSDYQCPFCAKWTHSTLPEMLKYAEAGDLRIEWRDINVYGEPSERGALAAHAAGLQGKYWEFHDALYPNGEHLPATELSKEALVGLAGKLGLDADRLSADMDSPEVQNLIKTYAQQARDLGVTGTPSFILGGTPIVGAQPTQVFVDAVEAALAKAKQ